MENFTPFSATIGGALIGLSASILLLSTGRIAGISGIVGGIFSEGKDLRYRFAFLAGLLVGGILLTLFYAQAFTVELSRSPTALVTAGVLVGVGTRIGSGCTSGHGVCGLSRFSTRSLVATCTFMGFGFLSASLITVLLGGAI